MVKIILAHGAGRELPSSGELPLRGDDPLSIEVSETSSFLDVIKAHDKGILKKAVAVKANGEVRAFKSRVGVDGQTVAVEPVTLDSKEGLEIYRHSVSHVMAQAVRRFTKASCSR